MVICSCIIVYLENVQLAIYQKLYYTYLKDAPEKQKQKQTLPRTQIFTFTHAMVETNGVLVLACFFPHNNWHIHEQQRHP